MSHRIFPRVPPEGPDDRWYSQLEEVIRHYDITITPASVGANTSAEEAFTVTGLRSNDFVIVNGPAQTAGIGIAGFRASGRDEVSITFINATGGALSPASGAYQVMAISGE